MIAVERQLLVELDAARRIAVPKALSEQRRRLEQSAQQIALKSKELLMAEGGVLSNLGEKMQRLYGERIGQERELLELMAGQLVAGSTQLVQRQRERLENMEDKVRLLHPDNILKRGFSITRLQGKAVTGAEALRAGDRIVTQLYQGEVTSVVEE